MEKPRPSRKERRAQDRAQRKQREATGLSRRTVLKRLTIAGAAIGVGGAAVAVVRSTEPRREPSFKEKVLSFTWKDAENREKLRSFVETLANTYIDLAQTPRLQKDELLTNTTFYSTTEEFLQAVRGVAPHYNPEVSNWGATDVRSKRTFMDLQKLKEFGLQYRYEAGTVLVDGLWHEWGHLDITERTTGELIENPTAYFRSPVSQKDETYKRYRGGEVLTETYFGFRRWNEVLNETIIIRRMVEQVGLQRYFTAGDYIPHGTDLFPNFTVSTGIPLNTLYDMYATSDWEGLARLCGQYLPGRNSPLMKGRSLFIGIHDGNPQMIQETGVFTKITPIPIYQPKR